MAKGLCDAPEDAAGYCTVALDGFTDVSNPTTCVGGTNVDVK